MSLQLELDKIDLSGWDARRYEEDPVEFEALVKSIKENGVLFPITVYQLKNGRYRIIVGRRRVRASKEAGLQTIPAVVEDRNITDANIHKRTFFENLHKRRLQDLEQAYGILQMYLDSGRYTSKDVIQGVKSLHNKEQSEKKAKNKRIYTREQEQNFFVPDEEFIKICDSIGYSANYQYAKIQFAIQVERQVMEEADKKKLSTRKKTLLTNTQLRNEPYLQLILIDEIEKMTDEQAELHINQTIHDLKTGYLKRSKSGKTYFYDDPNKREKISTKRTELDEIEIFQKNTEEYCQKLLYGLTGYALTRNQLHYTDENIKNTHTHRLQIAKSMNSDLRSLRLYKKWFLNPVYLALKDMIEILDTEIETAENKQEMLKQ